MVCEVNATQVSVEERLSDHVYAYDIQTHEIYRADMEMEHTLTKESSRDDKKNQLDKSTEIKEKVRESVKEKLVAKQKVVADVKKDAVTIAKNKNRATGIE